MNLYKFENSNSDINKKNKDENRDCVEKEIEY